MREASGSTSRAAATAAFAVLWATLAVREVHGANSSVLSPVAAPIAFFWSTQNDSNLAIPSCATFPIFTADNPGSNAVTTPPFYFVSAPIGGVPTTRLVRQKLGGQFNWVANYPIGTVLELAMSDSANNSGGAVGPYTIIDGTDSCNLVNSNASPIVFTVDPPNNACDELDISISGRGVPPYTVSVITGSNAGLYSNLTDVQSNSFKMSNVVAAGTQYALFITDSQGTASQVSQLMTSELGSGNCVQPQAASDSSSSLGALIGGVVGGVLGALVLVLIGFYFFRKRKNRAAEEAYREDLNPSDDYRLSDGTAPVVTPFFVPPRNADDSDYSKFGAQGIAPSGRYAEDGNASTLQFTDDSLDSAYNSYNSHYPLRDVVTHNTSPTSPVNQNSFSHVNTHGTGQQRYHPSDFDTGLQHHDRDSSEPDLAHPDQFDWRR